jgi:hypothetical protein
VRPWHRSPSRMAIQPGSSIRALRVGSGRGPTFRTAPRGARSGRMKHATGFTCPGRGDHQDRRVPEPLVASALSPDIPPEPACRPPPRLGVSARARFRPLLTCFRAALAGCATRDLAWAPGLPPTGKTVQRLGTQLAFDGCSCSPHPALSCRPLLALPELILRCFLGDLAWAPDAAPTGSSFRCVTATCAGN